MKNTELRKDYIQEKYVLIAPQRQKRPHDEVGESAAPPPTHIPQKSCQFCPHNIQHQAITDRVGKKGNHWEILTIENKFPAVSLRNPRSYGQQEVIVDTRYHEKTFEEFHHAHIVRLLKMYQRRVKVLSQLPNIQYVLTFKNQGGRAGASVHHSHSQIMATGFLPPQLFDKSRRTHEYFLRHGRCAYCDVLKKEKDSERWIGSDRFMACLAPYASMHNYEAWILPWRHVDNITELNNNELHSLARALQHIVKKIVALGLPYNYYFHQVVFDEAQHMYVKIIPRGAVWAGVEIGSGIIINPIPPEEAARYYRKGWGEKQ